MGFLWVLFCFCCRKIHKILLSIIIICFMHIGIMKNPSLDYYGMIASIIKTFKDHLLSSTLGNIHPGMSSFFFIYISCPSFFLLTPTLYYYHLSYLLTISHHLSLLFTAVYKLFFVWFV